MSSFVHDRFLEHAQRTPQAVALSYGSRVVRYGELERMSAAIAAHLIERGVRADEFVALYYEPSVEMIAALLAVLRVGAAYVPVDPHSPAERVRFILKDSGAKLLLTNAQGRAALQPSGLDGVAVEELGQPRKGELACLTRGEHAAYMIYTSGSTGMPKGVIVTHQNVARLFEQTHAWFSFDARDVWTLFHSYAFDFSVWEIWGALAYGGRLVVVPKHTARTPSVFWSLLARENVTVLNQTPSAFRQLIPIATADASPPPALRAVILGGERLDPRVLEPWFDVFGEGHPALINMYGITETTVHVTYHPLGRGDVDDGRSIIGVTIPDLEVYLLDAEQRPVGYEDIGEIYVAGEGLARGYHERPQLNEQRFLVREGVPGGRLYRAGDLARRVEGGKLEFLGRVDSQVKVRGFRIEIGEIEARLCAQPGVEDAVVLCRAAGSDPELVAYVIPSAVDAPVVRRSTQLVEAHESARGQETVESLDQTLSLYEPTEDLMVMQVNRRETEFLAREIFGEGAYREHSWSLPAGATVVDVGANIGMFALLVKSRCDDVRVLAFEPIPTLAAAAIANMKLHGVDATVVEAAVGHTQSKVELTYYPNNTVMSGKHAQPQEDRALVRAYLRGMGELPEGEMMERLLQDRLRSSKVECEVMTLSHALPRFGIEHVDLLKIDVEKAELDVLLGIDSATFEKIDRVLVEVHEDAEGRLGVVMDLLRSHGFEMTVSQDRMLVETSCYNVYGARPSLTVSVAKPSGRSRFLTRSALLTAVKAGLASYLPAHMLPSRYVLVNAIPLTGNGKLDEKALHALADRSADVGRSGSALRSETELRLGAIWRQVLKVDELSSNSDFFADGGNSLMAICLLARIEDEFGEGALNPSELFESAVLGQLARRIDESRSQSGVC